MLGDRAVNMRRIKARIGDRHGFVPALAQLLLRCDSGPGHPSRMSNHTTTRLRPPRLARYSASLARHPETEHVRLRRGRPACGRCGCPSRGAILSILVMPVSTVGQSRWEERRLIRTRVELATGTVDSALRVPSRVCTGARCRSAPRVHAHGIHQCAPRLVGRHCTREASPSRRVEFDSIAAGYESGNCPRPALW